MRTRGIVILVATIALAIALAFASAPASAIDRDSGEFWTYDALLEIDGVPTNGTITYHFEDRDSIIVGNVEYDINVYSMEGSLWGSLDWFDSTSVVSAALGGFVYETTDGMAILEEDEIKWTNSSWSLGSDTFASYARTGIVSLYDPPLMSAFDPRTTGLGDTWLETINVETITEIRNATEPLLNSHDYETMTISFMTSSALETVVTSAGEFKALRITATVTQGKDEGSHEVYYWSSEVQNFVKREAFGQGHAQPYLSLTLKDYRLVSLNTVLFVMVGIAVLAAALMILTAVLLTRRRPGQPVTGQPATPPVPPPWSPSS